MARSEMIPCIEVPFDHYVRMVRENWRFYQCNMGDAEWANIVAPNWWGNKNSDNVTLSKSIGLALESALYQPFTYIGTNCGNKQDKVVYDYIKRARLQAIPWVFKETISAANCNGYIAPLFREFTNKKSALVGGPHLMNLKLVDFDWKIEVHPTEAVHNTQNIAGTVEQILGKVDVICFSAGFATNLVMAILLKKHGNRCPTMIDMGACFDPYVGVYNRKRYRQKEWQQNEMQKIIKETLQ